jgi:arylsulfatase
LIFVAIGDNGASKEGTLQGTINQSLFSKENLTKKIPKQFDNIGEIGTAKGLNTIL